MQDIKELIHPCVLPYVDNSSKEPEIPSFLEVLSTVIMTNQTNAMSGIITRFLLYLMPGKGVCGYGD